MDNWRITVLGDGGVGKTALAVQYMLGCFVETYDPTIEDAYRKQAMVDDRLCFVEVIDTAGQEEYATLREQWVREGQGFVLVYSIASRSTFERLEVFRQSMLRVKGGRPTYILVGNKYDKNAEREVLPGEGQRLADDLGCRFLETSAKTAHNVDELFSSLIRTLRSNRDGIPMSDIPPTPIAYHPEAPLKPTKKQKKSPKCIIL